MAFVADVPRSIAFYRRLGFELGSTVPGGAASPTWAELHRGPARLMLARASDPVDAHQQAVLFYLYFDDIATVHAALQADGLDVGALAYPFYCPKGEFRLADPDGYVLMLTHT